MRPLYLVIPILSLISISVFCKNKDNDKCACEEEIQEVPADNREFITRFGKVYVGMPKKYLKKAGFTKRTLLDYHKQDNEEWMTFSDITTRKKGDVVIFYIVDRKIKDWIKPSTISKGR